LYCYEQQPVENKSFVLSTSPNIHLTKWWICDLLLTLDMEQYELKREPAAVAF
jgi:hypothetical protein